MEQMDLFLSQERDTQTPTTPARKNAAEQELDIPGTILPMSIAAPEPDNAGGLSEAETKELGRLEEEIEQDLKAFVRVGMRLALIRDNRLWRADGSFGRYLARRWKPEITEARASQLISGSALVRQLESLTIVKELPGRESHTRQLIRLKDEEAGQPDVERAARVWGRIVEQSRGDTPFSITARHVKEAVDAELGAKPPEPVSFVEVVRKRLPNLTKSEIEQLKNMLRAYP